MKIKERDRTPLVTATIAAMAVRGATARTCYECGVRVPLLMRWPGHTDKGRRVGELVSAVDLMPTLLAAAGAETPADLPGRSLLPLARGEACPWQGGAA